MSILSKLRTKKPSAAVTLNFQVGPEMASRLEEAANRSKIARYDICRALIEQGLEDLITELDNEVPDLTPTPEYTDTIAEELE